MRELSGRLKEGNTITVFVSIISVIRSTSYSSLFSSYQNEKCTWDEISIYIYLFLTKLSFPNSSVQYDASHFYWHQYFDEGASFRTKEWKFWKFPVLLFASLIFATGLLFVPKSKPSFYWLKGVLSFKRATKLWKVYLKI